MSAPVAVSEKEEDRWRVEDALRTLQRAGEIVHDAKLMAKVKEMAGEKADEMKVIAKSADALAKAGRISPKQMAKLAAR
ncbi:MAG: hypothetical protein PS018_20340 [bacterium]|nr:hypothetical protein [bacterium]